MNLLISVVFVLNDTGQLRNKKLEFKLLWKDRKKGGKKKNIAFNSWLLSAAIGALRLN
jgi:hypothetical protein